MKEWKLKNKTFQKQRSELYGYHPVIAKLLYYRGLKDQDQAEKFFNPEYDELHDPFLFSDMKKAVKRIFKAIDNKEKILIHGDYDADGVTSAAVLYKTLKKLGNTPDVFIPHREKDGYGLNTKNIKKFVESGVDLLITVDCGITNVKEIKALADQGIETIVTDHHEPPEQLPEAVAILDPKVEKCSYPFKELAGVGVAYKLAVALLDTAKPERLKKADFSQFGETKGFKKWLLDLVAVGTVADIVPLLEENRILVKWGLVVLNQTKNIGLKKLFKKLNTAKVEEFTIGYQIAPRLNAAGRLKSAQNAFELLVTEDEGEAERLVCDLDQNNKKRQDIVEKAMIQARQTVIQRDKILFLYHEEWLPGVVGLIAGRLSEEYYKPVLAMTSSVNGIVGSGRSIEGVNIIFNLRRAGEYLLRFGGHSGACGFTLKSPAVKEKFERKMKQVIERDLSGKELKPFLTVDMKIKLREVDIFLLRSLERFSPYGEKNEKPLFLINDLQIAAMDLIGKKQNHLRLMVKQDLPILSKMILFSRGKEWFERLDVGDKIKVVCQLGINRWNGNEEPEYKIVDIKLV
ncbi:MAG TPA: single-stranded-DNA-specific exonuclease RecJ [Patescibacteria group bacterium]|nr:single-stranded-DNA-specific exonuclease RecJ [Patescibacteria group bacterium]